MKENHRNKFDLHPISKASITVNAINEHDNCNLSEDPMSLDEIVELRQKERKKLLELYGQSTERSNEIEHTMFLKHQFISKTLPYRKENQYKVLNMLLADRGILFTFGNDGYWNRKINYEINSKHRRLFRDKTLQEELYQGIPAWQYISSESEKEIHIELLRRITRIAAEKHQNLSSWVKGNISRETPSIEERMSLVKFPPEYQDEEKTKMLKKIRPLITKIIPDPMCRWMLSQSPAYLVAEQNLELFQDMLPEHRDKIDLSFCRIFVNDILPDYMQAVEWAKTLEYRPDHVPDCQRISTAYDFICYKRRLLQLEVRQKEFQQKIPSVLRSDELLCFGTGPINGDVSSNLFQIEMSIISYFCKLSYPLGQDEIGYLKQRINWAMNIQPTLGILCPAFILYMVICCGRRLTLSVDVPIPEQTGHPKYIKRVSWRKQRYEQLLLLDKLCDILGVAGNDRGQNWNQFLFWQGKNIESEEECNFWIEQKRRFKLIPEAIGFQLLCRKYLSKCFPIYIEDLSYAPCSKLHLGGFLQFWKDNREEIYEQAVLLEKEHPQLIKEYFAFWKSTDTENYFFEGTAWLNKLLERSEVDFCNFREIPDCDLQELQRLILETEFRICISKKSRKKFAKYLQQTYEFSPGLFEGIL